jgi:hypothetical protein
MFIIIVKNNYKAIQAPTQQILTCIAAEIAGAERAGADEGGRRVCPVR